MLRTLAILLIFAFVTLSFTLSYAQMSKEEFKAGVEELKNEIRDAHKEYVDAKKQLTQATLQKLSKISAEDTAAHDKIMLDDRKKRGALTREYETAVKAVSEKRKALIQEKRESAKK